MFDNAIHDVTTISIAIELEKVSSSVIGHLKYMRKSVELSKSINLAKK